MWNTLTNELIRKGWAHLQEVEKLGGMAKAIETGLPKMRIEEAAARRQAAIDSGRNPSSASTNTAWNRKPKSTFWKWTTPPSGKPRSPACRNCARGTGLRRVRSRAGSPVRMRPHGEGNLLDLAIKAAKARASPWVKSPPPWKNTSGVIKHQSNPLPACTPNPMVKIRWWRKSAR